MSLLNIQSHARMGVQEKRTSATPVESEFEAEFFYRPGLIARCSNPECRSGMLHLFRKRSAPVFERGWTCSPECTEARILCALQRELDRVPQARATHRHRIPLGLLMLEHGWITRRQLRVALEAQKTSASRRIGELLISSGATDEGAVARALGLQWSCPVLSPDTHSHSCAPLVPRLFIDVFGVLPLRVAGNKVLYIGFEQSLDPALALAVERMLGFRIESGIVPSTVFRTAFVQALKEEFPPVQMAQAVSVPAASHLLARAVERTRPVASRLVRVHDWVWLRMWRSQGPTIMPRIGSIVDVVCSIGTF